jgi:two-component sensor histidine kinase
VPGRKPDLPRQLTLRSGLLLVVAASMLPISVITVIEAFNVLNYNRTLIGNRLATSALATAGRVADPLIIAERSQLALSRIDAVRSMGPACNDVLIEGLADSPVLVNFLRLDATGRVRCSALHLDARLSFANSAWWQRGIKSQNFTLSPPLISPVSKRRVLFGMRPLTKPDGTFDGALIVAVSADWLEQTLATEKLSQHATVAVVGPNGRELLIDHTSLLPQFDMSLATGQALEAKSKDGKTWLYAVAPLYKQELFIVYAEPRNALMAIVVQQMRVSLILPLIALILTSLAIWIGTNRLVIRWLDRLSALAAQFAKGEYRNDPGTFDKAPYEIAHLSTELHNMGRAIESRDHELHAALDAKTALTSEVHHRVKNNLQIVSSLLSLQASRITDPAAREALAQTRARIGALAQIHRLLYEESHDSDVVDLSRLLNDLCTQLRSLHRHQSGISLQCIAQKHVLLASLAVPLSLFAVEAITNGFRHAFPTGRSGAIMVRSGVSEDRGYLIISDDGVGFDTEGVSQSMGHQLMSAFAEQLDGSFSTAQGETGGSVINLTYPLGSAS